MYARYPFVGSVSKLSKRMFGVEMDVEELLDLYPNAIDLAKAMVEGRGPAEDAGCDDLCAVLAYRIALVLVAAARSNWLRNNFAVNVAKRASEFFKKEGIETVVGVLKACGFWAEVLREPLRVPLRQQRGAVYAEEYLVRTTLMDYVRLAKRFLSDPTWKVVNKALLGGFVYLKEEELRRLAEEAVVIKVLEDLRELGDVDPQALPERFKGVLEELKTKYMAKRSSADIKIKGFEPRALPPCVRSIYERALQGDNLSHQERFTLATFLLNVGKDVEDVLEVFKNMPDYNERIARYQVEHLAGLRGSHKKYSPPSCKTLVSWGLCPGKDECKGDHPLKEYWRRLRRLTKAPSREPRP